MSTINAPSGAGAMVAMFGGGAAFTGLATWLVLAGDRRWGGAAASGAAVFLTGGAVLARRDERPLPLFVDAVLDRAFDGCLLSVIVLASRFSNRPAAAAAAAALALSFLAAYVRARGQSLGYPVEEGIGSRVLRYGLISAGLLVGGLAVAMFALLAVVSLTAAIRASQVAKQERE